MSELKNLCSHLRECVDSDDFTAVTENGVEFGIFDWAFGLSLKAMDEHDGLVQELEQLRKEVEKLEAVKEYTNKKLHYLNSNGVQSFQLDEVKRLMNG